MSDLVFNIIDGIVMIWEHLTRRILGILGRIKILTQFQINSFLCRKQKIFPLHQVFIHFGGNLGNRKETILSGLQAILANGKNSFVRVSSLYETEAWGMPNQSDFLNGVLEIKTELFPRELMGFLLDVERMHGRERRQKWGPRTLDLDMLFYDDCILKSAFLELPHPRMQMRNFVLEPLGEIAPFFSHPVFGMTIKELQGWCQDSCETRFHSSLDFFPFDP